MKIYSQPLFHLSTEEGGGVNQAIWCTTCLRHAYRTFTTVIWNNAYFQLFDFLGWLWIHVYLFFNCVYKKGKVIKIYAKLYLSIVVYANDSFLPTKFVKYTQSQYWDLISILTHFDDFGILCTCFALHSLVAPLTAIHTGPSDVITRFLSNALTTGLCAVLSICTTGTFC